MVLKNTSNGKTALVKEGIEMGQSMKELEARKANLEAKLEEVKEKQAELKRKHNKQLRSKRTHHLILLGAAVESALGVSWWKIDPDVLKDILKANKEHFLKSEVVNDVTLEEWGDREKAKKAAK